MMYIVIALIAYLMMRMMDEVSVDPSESWV